MCGVSKSCPNCGYIKPKKPRVVKLGIVDINYYQAWFEGYNDSYDDSLAFAKSEFRKRMYFAIVIGQLLTIYAYWLGRW